VVLNDAPLLPEDTEEDTLSLLKVRIILTLTITAGGQKEPYYFDEKKSLVPYAKYLLKGIVSRYFGVLLDFI
jgi:hypothetical protein